NELHNRGKTELIQVLIPLKTLAVEDATPEVRKMLTPVGSVSMLPKTNTLVIVDTAGNLRRIAEAIRQAEEALVWDGPRHRCRWRSAREVAEILDKLLAGKDTRIELSGTSPPGGYYDPRGYDPRGTDRRGTGDSADRVKAVCIAVDE